MRTILMLLIAMSASIAFAQSERCNIQVELKTKISATRMEPLSMKCLNDANQEISAPVPLVLSLTGPFYFTYGNEDLGKRMEFLPQGHKHIGIAFRGGDDAPGVLSFAWKDGAAFDSNVSKGLSLKGVQ